MKKLLLLTLVLLTIVSCEKSRLEKSIKGTYVYEGNGSSELTTYCSKGEYTVYTNVPNGTLDYSKGTLRMKGTYTISNDSVYHKCTESDVGLLNYQYTLSINQIQLFNKTDDCNCNCK